MAPSRTRRAVLAAIAGAGPVAAALSPVGEFADRGAPLSGSLWGSLDAALPDRIESGYGPATVTYDDWGVPHVEAASEEAAYHAVGFVQAADRLGQMDLFRRRAGGTLAAAVGEQGIENDRFAAKMDFRGAAEASREAIRGTDTEVALEAYRDGVNAYIEREPPGAVFGALDYEPEPWTLVDTALIGTQLSWSLTGDFSTLRREVLRERLDAETLATLYPERFDHGVPIVGASAGGEVVGTATDPVSADTIRDGAGDEPAAVGPELVDWLSGFEAPRGVGSNSWVVAGEVTDTGAPVVCNDPHLALTAPPLWYQQQVTIDGFRTRGAALAGTPFVVIGENDRGAWGVTNVGADVLDVYEYDLADGGDAYRYRGETRAFDTERRTIEVAGGTDETVEVRRTVHGVYIDREIDGDTRSVGVAWTGMTGTREIRAIHGWNRSRGLESFRAATEKLDVPTQNVVYADADGNTLYQMSGKIPVRRVDGDVVRGDRVFDGSAGEAEWRGFEPFGESTWAGFVPYEEKLAVLNPTYLSTANQRPADDPAYPVGQRYASGFRATRIAEVLDRAREEGGTVDETLLRNLQTDTVSVFGRLLAPVVLEARERMPARAEPWVDALAEWDHRMTPDSRAALAFVHFARRFRERTWRDDFQAVGLDESYWPQGWVLATLPADSAVFDGDRGAVAAAAMGEAVDDIEAAGWETYGDYNRTAIDHPLGGVLSGMNYERLPTGGSPSTVRAFSTEGGFGASYGLVASLGGESRDIVPGGNDGSPVGEHYDDQLPLWARGEFRRLDDVPGGDPDLVVEGER